MEKKFDFKTIAFACLLFFGFVFLLFYKFSSADDAINHYKKASEIFSSQQDFVDFKSSLPNHILPEWYSEEESLTNLLDTIACFAIGDYLQVGSNIVSELSGQITGDPLFLEHFVFDYDSLSWVFDSDTSDFIKNGLDPLIYDSPSADAGENVVGHWYVVPCHTSNDPDNGSWKFREYMSEGTVSAPLYACSVKQSNSSCLLVFASFVSGQTGVVEHKIARPGSDAWQNNGSSSVSLSTSYQGSESLGYYGYFGAGYNYLIEGSQYNDLSAALADLFGTTGDFGGDPTLIDGVSIRNDDFTVKPLSYPSSVMVDYPSLITEPDYDPDDYRLIFEYTPTMEVPFWLKNPTTEPISYELPTDYDFGNIEFEYDADPSYLAGAGIVQDVFEILPSSLQGLIALFGAGSLAFIFLRR